MITNAVQTASPLIAPVAPVQPSAPSGAFAKALDQAAQRPAGQAEERPSSSADGSADADASETDVVGDEGAPADAKAPDPTEADRGSLDPLLTMRVPPRLDGAGLRRAEPGQASATSADAPAGPGMDESLAGVVGSALPTPTDARQGKGQPSDRPNLPALPDPAPSSNTATAAPAATPEARPAIELAAVPREAPALNPAAVAAGAPPSWAAPIVSAPGTSGASASAPTVQAQVPTPLDSPGFGAAFGAQLSIMARDGVKEARLQLNPAELGPVTVQITVHGHTARVDLVAEQALTRQVLEQSMPSLASALRESGLTLTGGGVFEQPRRSDPGGDGNGQGGRNGQAATGGTPDDADGDDAHLAALGLAQRPGRAQGVVDLYA